MNLENLLRSAKCCLLQHPAMNRSIDHHPQRNKYCGASAQVIVTINIGQHWCLGTRQPGRSEIDFGARLIYQYDLEKGLNPSKDFIKKHEVTR